MSYAKVLEITFGSIFQEFSDTTFIDRRLTSTKLNLIWVIVTMLLSMSFVGNLKAILMRKEFEDVPTTKAEVIDRDMRLLMTRGMEQVLELYALESDMDKRILCQTRKTNGFYDAGKSKRSLLQVQP